MSTLAQLLDDVPLPPVLEGEVLDPLPKPSGALVCIDVRANGEGRVWTFRFTDGTKYETHDAHSAQHLAECLFPVRIKEGDNK